MHVCSAARKRSEYCKLLYETERQREREREVSVQDFFSVTCVCMCVCMYPFFSLDVMRIELWVTPCVRVSVLYVCMCECVRRQWCTITVAICRISEKQIFFDCKACRAESKQCYTLALRRSRSLTIHYYACYTYSYSICEL